MKSRPTMIYSMYTVQTFSLKLRKNEGKKPKIFFRTKRVQNSSKNIYTWKNIIERVECMAFEKHMAAISLRYILLNKQLTGSSFINHCIDEEGCDLPDVQLIFNVSPIWYWLCSPLMCGPSRGKSIPLCMGSTTATTTTKKKYKHIQKMNSVSEWERKRANERMNDR